MKLVMVAMCQKVAGMQSLKDGEPIVGEVLEWEGIRSGRWRFIEVEWLN